MVRISPKLAEDQIRAEILKQTPIGSSADQVLEFARDRLKHIGPQPTYEPGSARGRQGRRTVRVGVRSLSVCLGEYGPWGRCVTYLSWGFDEQDKLLDVMVEKEHDAL